MKQALGRIFLVFCALGGLGGCSPAKGASPAHPSDLRDPVALREVAAAFAAQGESNRAEQYYVAALQAGADPREVYPPLVETCIQAGRLGSAFQHAERHLRDVPEDLRLLGLAVSLGEALGHMRAAREYAARIEQLPNKGAEDEIFLGAYFERQQMNEKAQEHLEKYLALTPKEDQEPWVRPTLRRLAQSSQLHAEGVAHLPIAADRAEGESAE